MKTAALKLDNIKNMNISIKRVMDYLYEETFLIDKDIIEDDIHYRYLFESLWNFFKKKNITDSFEDAMKYFILYCIINNDHIDINVLLDNVNIIKKYSNKFNYVILFNKFDINKLKDKCHEKIIVLN